MDTHAKTRVINRRGFHEDRPKQPNTQTFDVNPNLSDHRRGLVEHPNCDLEYRSRDRFRAENVCLACGMSREVGS